MRNTKVHSLGDKVYIQQYCWPPGVVRYIVDKIRTETGKPTVYELSVDGIYSNQLTTSAWSYEVFDTFDGAFEYSYEESYHADSCL